MLKFIAKYISKLVNLDIKSYNKYKGDLMIKPGELFQIAKNYNRPDGAWTFLSEDFDYVSVDHGTVCLLVEKCNDTEFHGEEAYVAQSSCGRLFVIHEDTFDDGVCTKAICNN